MNRSGAPALVTRWLGQTMRGKYRISRLIGEGGGGAVYEAEHLFLRRRVAIKVLHGNASTDSKRAERFRREAMAATRIGHPNIIEVLDLDTTEDGTAFMVLELLSGIDLERAIDAEGPMPLSRAIHVFRQIASALAAAHRVGIIHRDLKPGNVFLVRRQDEPDFVKILDFGIAKLSSTLSQESLGSITHTGAILGTPYYMSPEQLAGDPNLDFRTDIYSLGVMLFEALVGHPPFEATNLPALVTKVMTSTAGPVASVRADVPRELSEVVVRMLEKSRDRRPSNCDEVLAVLDGVAAGLGRAFDTLPSIQPRSLAELSSDKTVVDASVPLHRTFDDDHDGDENEQTTVMHVNIGVDDAPTVVGDYRTDSGMRSLGPAVTAASTHLPAVMVDFGAVADPNRAGVPEGSPPASRMDPTARVHVVGAGAERRLPAVATTLLAGVMIIVSFVLVATITYYLFRGP